MRRKDREVVEITEIEEIIKECKTCHIAMIDGNRPYVVPISFGYELCEGELTLYFHCAKEGRKIDILHKNNQVCFEMCHEGYPVNARSTPCNSGFDYCSVIGNGKVQFVDDIEEKRKALQLIVKRQAEFDYEFTKEQVEHICVFKIETKDFTGKRKLPPM